MLLVGLNKVRDLNGAGIDKAWLGTASTAVSEAQTGLQSGVTVSKQDVTITTADKTNVINYTLPSTTATGNTYREFAFMLDGDTEYNRVLLTGVAHSANDDVVVRQTVFYRNP